MAVEKHTIDELDAAARYLEQSAQEIRLAIETMRKHGLESVLVHGRVVRDTYISAIWSWSAKLPFSAKVQGVDHANGRTTQAELIKRRSANDMARRKKKKEGTQ